jgi:hypothetical protein
MENTQGYLRPEIDVMNHVGRRLADEYPGLKSYSIDDAIHNNVGATFPTETELYTAAKRSLGLS